jgi:branched-chain amino acid transport system substrate-binding protein
MQVAATEINKAGGINGRQVEVTALDTQGDATRAVSLLRERLSTGAAPDLVIDGTVSNETVALLPILTQNKILSCGVTTTSKANQPGVYPYSFHIANHVGDGAAALATKLRAQGYHKIGLFQQNDANGKSSQQGFTDALTPLGFEVVTEVYDPTGLDMTAPLQRLQALHPDAIIVTATGPSAPYVLTSRLTAGITTPTYLDSSITTDVAALAPAAALQNVSVFTFRINQFAPDASRSASLKSFYSGMAATGDVNQILFVYSAAHDCLQVTAMAGNQAKSAGVDEVKAALENLQQPAVKPYVSFGNISYTAKDHFVAAVPDDYVIITPIPKIAQGTWKNGGPSS